MRTATNTATAAVELRGVTRTYGQGSAAVSALRGVDLTLRPGTFTAVMGPSGSGKSTLLHCAAGLERPTDGDVLIDGEPVTGRSEAALTRFRRTRVAVVFQEANLIEHLTVRENVVLPLTLAARRIEAGAVEAVLRRVGLGDRADHRPGQLSGGEQQRAAIARALHTGPSLLLADEPTGALDSANARAVLDLLRECVDDLGQTLVMVTHDPVSAARADEVVFLRDGRVVDALPAPTADGVAERMTRLGRRSAEVDDA